MFCATYSAKRGTKKPHQVSKEAHGKMEGTKLIKMILHLGFNKCHKSFPPNLQWQINGRGSVLQAKSQINFSLSILHTQQVVAKRLESEPGVSQLWHLKWALHTDATDAPLANSPPSLTSETLTRWPGETFANYNNKINVMSKIIAHQTLVDGGEGARQKGPNL